jgi:putative copper export protein
VPHWVETTLLVAHVLGATVWVGGTVALTFVAVPAIRLLTGEPRANAMRELGERWRPLGWGALIAMVATGAPLAAEELPGSSSEPKIVFGVKMLFFAMLLCTAYLHDFVIGPKVSRDMRATGTSPLRPRLVLVGWTSFTLTLSIPILGVVLAEIL